jgi:hypothetical protein
MRGLSFILIALTFLFEMISAEDRCRSYVCGPLNNTDCAVEVVGADLNYNYTLQDCNKKTQYCPWTSLLPGTNSTISCNNNTTPGQQR